MQNCELVTLISILACKIAEGKTPEEIAILSTFFVQLRGLLGDNSSVEYK